MTNPEFLSFLQQRLDGARLDFLEAKRQLEDFEIEWGGQVYSGAWERRAQELADRAHQGYLAYKKAWVEWYAAANGFSLTAPRQIKDTPVFASAVPARRQLAEFWDPSST